MKLLLDTHTLVWWDSQSVKLSKRAFDLCSDSANTVLISVVRIWEIQIKLKLGKLVLNESLEKIVENQQQANKFEILPITLNHVLALDNLPLYHKAFFDRLLIAQAIVENAVLVSNDSVFFNYGIKVEWQGKKN